MKSLLLVAHGSRRTESNDEVARLTGAIEARVGERYGYVAHAFLELASPSLAERIDGAIEAGSDQIVVVPYFLAAGTHVARDIPAVVDAKREQFPDVEIRVAGYLGSAEGVAEILAALADVA